MIKAVLNYSILTKTQLVVEYNLEPSNITHIWVLPDRDIVVTLLLSLEATLFD